MRALQPTSIDRIVDPSTQTELFVPVFATPELTLRRAERARHGLIPILLFDPQYGNDWPLWTTDGTPVSPHDYGLSGDLTDRIRVWYGVWCANVVALSRWQSEATRLAWILEGSVLAQDLADEVWADADVIDEHWRYGP